MKDWARGWLEDQRKKGEKCLEIKYIQDKPYVYRSTSVYDKATKSPRKKSKYLGNKDIPFKQNVPNRFCCDEQSN